MTIAVEETPWVKVKPGDPSFRLNGTLSTTTRAAIDIADSCPANIAEMIIMATKRGWIRPVAYVPKDDPTLIWDTLTNGN